MSDPRSGSNPDDPNRDHQYGPPPPYPHPTPGQQQPRRPSIPALVNYLSIGMFVLVGLQVLSAVLTLVTLRSGLGTAPNQVPTAPGLSPQQAEDLVRAGLVGASVVSLLLAALFLWLTIMVRRGRNWARITSTVFLSLGIIIGLLGLGGGATIVGVIMLAIEIAVLVMLWMTPSNEYFRPSGSSF